ncbi:MAG: acyl-CoA dehydrogenase [Gammaproteobacteria bacterium]|nr:acyl-CoA dehydrogenase [Gammaproteobacteria bacterium]
MWTLSDEQQMLRDSALRFVESEYTFERRRSDLEKTSTYEPDLWRQFAELGWLGIPFSEMHGGLDGTNIDLVVLFEALGKGLVVSPMLANVVLAGNLIARTNEEASDQLLPDLIAGELQLAFAYAEPQARYDLFDVESTAVSSATGYTLTGKKTLVLNAPDATHIVVSARTEGASRDQRGISLFLVPADTDGVRLKSYRTNDDHIAADISFDAVALPPSALLGEAGEALPIIEEVVDIATVALAAEGIGAMDAVMELTTEYLKTREQFGKPIGKNQALQFRMVEMFYALEESRSMLQWAATALDSGPAARRTAVSAMKVKLGETARFIGQQGVQLHGAIGLTDEYSVGHYYKRLESIRLLFGDPDHHLARYGRWSEAQNQSA